MPRWRKMVVITVGWVGQILACFFTHINIYISEDLTFKVGKIGWDIRCECLV